MAVWAGQAHGVDVGWSAVFPGDDVVYLTAFGTGGAACASTVPVAGNDRFDLSFGCVSMGASHPDGFTFTVKDNTGDSSSTHQTFQHCLRQGFTTNDLRDSRRVIISKPFDIGHCDEFRYRPLR